MTNEEKAKELQLDCIRNGCGDSTDIRSACEEMAEWKDQQFKEYMEKKQSELDGTRNKSNYELIEEIINELFKQD